MRWKCGARSALAINPERELGIPRLVVHAPTTWYSRMVRKNGTCTACDGVFALDEEGNVPAHDKAIVGECSGSNRGPMPHMNSKDRRNRRREAARQRARITDPVNDAIATPDGVPTTGEINLKAGTRVTVISGQLPGLGRNAK